MANAFALYLRFVEISLRAQLQYRASVIMMTLGALVISVVEFAGIWAMFDRFGNLRGWTLPEVGLLYGLIEITYGLGHTLCRGLDTFPAMVAGGDFDRVLVRPRSAMLQLVGRDFAIRRLGRVGQGLVVLLWSASALGIDWTPGRVLLLPAAIAGGICLFVGLWVILATIVFWTIEPLEIMNAFTDGGAYAAQYPMTIYGGWFRHFFTFVVPLACANYLPGLALMGKPDPLGSPAWAQWLAPLAGPLFLLLTLQLWRLGIRRYMSTGS